MFFFLSLNSDGSIRAGLDEHFLLEMTEFLGAFMEANLGRVLWMGEKQATCAWGVQRMYE